LGWFSDAESCGLGGCAYVVRASARINEDEGSLAGGIVVLDGLIMMWKLKQLQR
jgi:hypothetical protein